MALPRLHPTTWVRRAAVLAVLGLLVFVGVTAVQYGLRFHTLAFWELPSRISYCDRDYASRDSPAETRARIEAVPAVLPGDDPLSLVQIGRTIPLLGRPMWAYLSTDRERADLGIPCTMAIYLQTGDDELVPYDLLGGP